MENGESGLKSGSLFMMFYKVRKSANMLRISQRLVLVKLWIAFRANWIVSWSHSFLLD
jgi:hypothetical protein